MNRRAADYLASLDRDDAKRYAEFIFHAAFDGPRVGRADAVLDLVRESFPAWGGAPDFAKSAATTIPRLMAEHVEAGRLTGPVPETSEFWRAMLDRQTSKTRVALALEGSGALCAYHAGVYQALHEADIEPDWIAGESMGAMVGAVIAGNPPERRLEQLKLLWSTLARPALPFQDLFGPMSEWFAVTYGIPGLFRPNPTAALIGATSFYDLSPARETLLRLVDFDRLNGGDTRYAAGAVNISTGNFTFFDNARMHVGPDHILASMALPPGFPAIQIDREFYWGSALVSSTALQHVLNGAGDRATVVFQPYLFAVSERIPTSLNEVDARQNAIRYNSRARLIANYYVNTQWMRQKLRHALERLPDGTQTEEDRSLLNNLASQPRVSLVNLVYRRKAEMVSSATYNFDETVVAEHWAHGLADTISALGRDVFATDRGEGVELTTIDRERDNDH